MFDANGVLNAVKNDAFPAWRRERERLDRIDKWYRWDHEKPHQPRSSTREYKELQERSQTPWLGLVVTTLAQALYIEGYRRKNDAENTTSWAHWQANGMDSRQIAINRAALAYGLSYATVLPGERPLTGEPMPAIRGISPRRMITFYEDPAEDEWPVYALRVDPAKIGGEKGYNLKVYDDEAVHLLQCAAGGDGLKYIDSQQHDVGLCPVVRFANMLDLEGRADGEVEPFIPIAGRIDQTTFDRLVVQRFASWVVRTIAGMTPPDQLPEGETAEQWKERKKLLLRVEDILISDDPDTKFGSLPASSLDGFINARDADVKDLAAVSQTPPHHLLGQMANLSAEALAAAESALSRKVEERKHALGESYEQLLKLAAWVGGDEAGFSDHEAQVRWRDMESRSLAQAADALGKLATMLQIPVEMLWEKVPGFTQQDVDRAKALVEKGGALQQVMNELLAGNVPPAA